MRLLVTGGSGFIGSNFVLMASARGFGITNVDALKHGSNPENLAGMEGGADYSFVRGDITDAELMSRLVSEADMVVNFAAESHVDRSITDARPFMESNIMGVFVLLEAARKHDKRLVHISTDEVFGSLESRSASEDDVLNPSSPYSSSKASAELLVRSYVTTYGVKARITRCTNNYGPRQSAEKLIPKVIKHAMDGKKIPVYGTGKNVRDWIHVDDHCSGILRVMSDGRDGQSYNISTGNELDNLVIIRKILGIMGKPEDLIEFVGDRPGHDFRYSLDSSKMRGMGWRPGTGIDDGLARAVKWYAGNPAWWKAEDGWN
ncbi:MAG: dTDP-glucose 4,6-dehydratase [Nitrosopumilus sp.]|nr:dTDP-glucose 4,6-dehydratase [Nitrosopumilus sp.]